MGTGDVTAGGLSLLVGACRGELAPCESSARTGSMDFKMVLREYGFLHMKIDKD